MPETPPAAIALYRRMLLSGDTSRVQVRYRAAVLDRYREKGLRVQRTDTVGRVSSATWTVNFGICPGEEAIHVSFGDLVHLPEGEREHWAMHLAEEGLSANYLTILLHPGSCFDDGDTREWA
ncbi:MAG: hypothetical protein Kow0010_15950 [Dehalococcoidia bacterium]